MLNISADVFVQKMTEHIYKFNGRFLLLEDRIDFFSNAIRQYRIPNFLQEGETFLGKYYIVGVLPYTFIYANKLMNQSSVFLNKQNLGMFSRRKLTSKSNSKMNFVPEAMPDCYE